MNGTAVANSGFDDFSNFQTGWDVGFSSGTGYEIFTKILNFAEQIAPTLGSVGVFFGVGLNQQRHSTILFPLSIDLTTVPFSHQICCK